MLNSATIKSIQDIMRKDVGVDGDAQRIGQLTWLLFLKIFDDREQEWELSEDKYRSPIPEKLRWRKWAANPEGLTGDELLEFVNNELFRTLKNVSPDTSPRHKVIHDTFEDAYQYMKSGTLLRQVINKINESLDFNRMEDRHVFGDLYEQILKDLQSAGNAGEYYTPRAVTQFMVDMVNPKLGETLLDPACGTGGFLTCAIEHLRKQAKTPADEELLQRSVRGVEKKPLPHLLCVTNMLLHGIDTPTNVRHDNTLSRPLASYVPKDRVDAIITNPPFGGMEEDGIETNFPQKFRTRETADLFLVLILTLLKDGGRGAIVLPDGTLFGEGVKTTIKEKLLTECNLHTIVRLPNGVFNPYTGIKTNLLFFTKGEPTKEIWFCEHPYPPGAKSYNKTKPIRIEEFDLEKKWWKKRKETEYAWKVPVEQVQAAGYSVLPDESIVQLKTLFGRRFERLGPLEVQSLVTALHEGSVSNSRMRLESNEHATDVTKMLQGLVVKGFLDQIGQKRGAYYILRTPADVRANSLRTNVDSSHNQDDSLHSGADSSHMPENASQEGEAALQAIARPAAENDRLPPEQTRQIILQLCAGTYLTAAELGRLMNRNADGLRNRFLTPLVDDGLLERRFPHEPNRPDQAYTTKTV